MKVVAQPRDIYKRTTITLEFETVKEVSQLIELCSDKGIMYRIRHNDWAPKVVDELLHQYPELRKHYGM